MTAKQQRNILLGVFVVLLAALVWFWVSLPLVESFYFDYCATLPLLLSTVSATGIAAATAVVLGIARESLKPVQKLPATPSATAPRGMPLVGEAAWLGGSTAGTAAGIVIGLVYYFSYRGDSCVQHFIIPELIIYASFAGGAAGLSRLGGHWFRQRATSSTRTESILPASNPDLNELLGGALAAMLVGIPVGMLGVMTFGTQGLPFLIREVVLILAATIVGAVVIVFSTLYYDFVGNNRRMIRAVLIAFLIGVPAGAFAFAMLWVTDAIRFLDEGIPLALVSGAAIGIAGGFVVGLDVGLASILYRRWDNTSSPMRGGRAVARPDAGDAAETFRGDHDATPMPSESGPRDFGRERATWKEYLDFVMRVDRTNGTTYRVEADGPTGEAQSTFEYPISGNSLDDFLVAINSPRGSVVRGRGPKLILHAEKFGKQLYDAVMVDDVRYLFMSARLEMESSGRGLRLKLRLKGAPELAEVPWEFMHDGREFLTLSDETPIVRYLDMPYPAHPLDMQMPLRVLVTVSGPRDCAELNVKAEKARIEEALSHLIASGQVALDYTPDAVLNTLQRALRQATVEGKPYNIWHFIGHGGFEEDSEESVLLFTDEAGMSQPVGGFHLGIMFNSHPELRLAVLNACEGAHPSRHDVFAGVAGSLVEQQVPAVIGMQFPITDNAAITFAREFYSSIAQGLPVEAALVEARRAIFFMPNWVEWGTPVLFMRHSDGQLFGLNATH